MAQKFTFKTEKPTGRWRSFEEDHHYIKYNGKEVGSFDSDASVRIRLMVMKTETITDSNPNCPWKWITLKAQFATLDEAKTWLNANIESILKTFTLHQSD